MAPKTPGALDPIEGLNSPALQGTFNAMHTIGLILQGLAMKVGMDDFPLGQCIKGLENTPEHLGNDPDLIRAWQFPLQMLHEGILRAQESIQVARDKGASPL